jgi:hypothetical protein
MTLLRLALPLLFTACVDFDDPPSPGDYGSGTTGDPIATEPAQPDGVAGDPTSPNVNQLCHAHARCQR